MREVVTIQVGHAANHVGAHFWNQQEAAFPVDNEADSDDHEAIDHDVLFRAGRTVDGQDTYTPRVIMFDLKGSMGSVSVGGALYEDDSAGGEVDIAAKFAAQVQTWNDTVAVVAQPKEHRNEFLSYLDEEGDDEDAGTTGDRTDDRFNADAAGPSAGAESGSSEAAKADPGPVKAFENLKDDVRVWSDFLKLYLHPKSVAIINEYQHRGTFDPFMWANDGAELWARSDTRDRFEAQLHFYVEECDSLQGLQIMTDLSNGFGGLSAAISEYLADELGKKARVAFGIAPSESAVVADGHSEEYMNRARVLTSTETVCQLAEHSSLFVPLAATAGRGWGTEKTKAPGPLSVFASSTSLYERTAELAMTIDTATLPFRTQQKRSSMSDLSSLLSLGTDSMSIASAALNAPLSLNASTLREDAGGLVPYFDSVPLYPSTPFLHTVSPYASRANVQSAYADHIVVRGLPETLAISPLLSSIHKSKLSTAKEVFSNYFRPSMAKRLHVLAPAVATAAPFPSHLFNKQVDRNGLTTSAQRASGEGVASIAAIVSLQSGPVVGDSIGALLAQFSQREVRRLCRSNTVSTDTYDELAHSMSTIVENYSE